MMTIEQQISDFLQTPGLTDQQIAAQLKRLGATVQQVSNVTGLPVAEIQQRISAVDSSFVDPTEAINKFTQFLQTPGLTDRQIANEMYKSKINARQVSEITGLPLEDIRLRIAALTPNTQTTTAQPVAPAPQPAAPRPVAPAPQPVAPRPVAPAPQPTAPAPQPVGPTRLEQFAQFSARPGSTDAQLFAEMSRLGLTNQEVSTLTGIPLSDIESRINALAPNLPFANATQGLTQQFNNYTSIPIGAQYNPNVVGGTGSPYNQIMRQMTPVGNPYATAKGGLALGGYDPGLYERDRLAKIALRDAGINPYGGVLDVLGGAGGASGADGGGDGTGNAAAAAAASGSSAGAAGGPGGVGIGEGGGTGMGGYAKGGLVNRVAGPNPLGPDDGAGMLDLGEYVIKKSSVNKYGKGLLDMLNDGKIPAKKIKSLLG